MNMCSRVLEIRYAQVSSVDLPGSMFRMRGDHAETSDEAHNHSGLSVEKHSNNFVVSNDVLVLEVCKKMHGCCNSKK